VGSSVLSKIVDGMVLTGELFVADARYFFRADFEDKGGLDAGVWKLLVGSWVRGTGGAGDMVRDNLSLCLEVGFTVERINTTRR
jgi:hypothetical protein